MQGFDPRAAMRRHFAAWCEARKAARDAAPWLQAAGAARLADDMRANVRPVEAAGPEPLPEAASAPADPAPTQAPAEAAEALARLRELQATALPTRRIRDELTGPAIELLERAVAQGPATPAPVEDAPPAVGECEAATSREAVVVTAVTIGEAG